MAESQDRGEAPKPPLFAEASTRLPPQPLSMSPPLFGQVLPPGMSGEQTPRQVTLTATHHSGPLPPASEFKAYEEAHPGAAAWIMEEASKSAGHAREMERQGMRIAGRDELLARLLPFGVVALFLAVFTIVALKNVWVGSIGMGTVLAAVILAYLRGYGMTGDTPKEEAPKPGQGLATTPGQGAAAGATPQQSSPPQQKPGQP